MPTIKILQINIIIISMMFSLSFSSEYCQDYRCKSCLNYDFGRSCKECDTGYTLTSRKTCQFCTSNCKVCNDPCKECDFGYYLTNNEKCLKCPNNCDVCKKIPSENSDNTGAFCYTCKNGYYLNSKNVININN